MEVSKIKGHNAIPAYRGFTALLFGLKQTPDFAHIRWVDYFESFKEKSEEEKETLIRTALGFVPIDDEIPHMLSFVKDKNGIQYSSSNMNNLSLPEIIEIVVAVCMEIGTFKISTISDGEKKNLQTSQLISEVST